MCQAGIEANEARALVVLDSLDFIEACNDFIVVIIFFFEHPNLECIHLIMEGAGIKVLVVMSLGVARA